jgi:hypothetical protein
VRGDSHPESDIFPSRTAGVPLGFEFILLKHGPFSFDLSDEITAMRADSLLQYQPREPYGPSLFPTEESQEFLEQYPKTLKNCANKIQFVAERVGTLGVADLERLATALYITFNENGLDVSRAERITQLKPHIGIDEAHEAVKNVDALRREATSGELASSL